MNLVIFMFFSGKIHLQLASEDPLKSQTAYLTPFSIPKNQWIHLVVSYSDHVVGSKKLHSEFSSFKACSYLTSHCINNNANTDTENGFGPILCLCICVTIDVM